MDFPISLKDDPKANQRNSTTQRRKRAAPTRQEEGKPAPPKITREYNRTTSPRKPPPQQDPLAAGARWCKHDHPKEGRGKQHHRTGGRRRTCAHRPATVIARLTTDSCSDHLCALRSVRCLVVTACEDVKLLFTKRITIPSELKLKEKTSHQITRRMDLDIARGSVQLFNTIVHFLAKIVIQAGVLEIWSIVTVNMKSLTPFAVVWHNAHTPANPVFADGSPRGFLTQPLEQCGSEELPHREQAVHIAWRGALFKQVASQEIVCRSLK